MASVKMLFCLGLGLSAWMGTTADPTFPTPENIHWVSLDFKTILKWTANSFDQTYTVWYSWDKNNWFESADCIQLRSVSECDLTNHVGSNDKYVFADIKIEPSDRDHNYDPDELPHSYTPSFNPYKQSNISAVEFTVETVDKSRVRVNITDPLTSIDKNGKLLSIRDVFRNNLKYKINYWKSGSTGKRDKTSDFNVTEVGELDPGIRYCFMVAAYIYNRPQTSQYGAWSKQQCTTGDSGEMGVGTWVGVVFSVLITAVIIGTVIVVCCKRKKQRSHTSQTSQRI